MAAPKVAVVTAVHLAASAWPDAIGPCDVFGIDVASSALTHHDVVIVESAGIDVLDRLLPLERARSVWVHAGIGPAEVRRARSLGVELIVHREMGLQPLREVLVGDRRTPRIWLLGGAPAADGDAALLSLEDVLVLRLMSRGATVAEVRRITGYTANRVERIRQGVLAKLGVQTTGQAMARAMAIGIVRSVGTDPSA